MSSRINRCIIFLLLHSFSLSFVNTCIVRYGRINNTQEWMLRIIYCIFLKWKKRKEIKTKTTNVFKKCVFLLFCVCAARWGSIKKKKYNKNNKKLKKAPTTITMLLLSVLLLLLFWIQSKRGDNTKSKKKKKVEKLKVKQSSLSLCFCFFLGCGSAQRRRATHSRAQAMMVAGSSASRSSWMQHPLEGTKPSASGVMVGPL